MTSVIGNLDAQFVYFSRPSVHGLQYRMGSNGQTAESSAVQRQFLALVACTRYIHTYIHTFNSLICCATSLICRQEVHFGRPRPDFLSSALHDSSLTATARSLLLDRHSGTIYQKTSSLPRRWQFIPRRNLRSYPFRQSY